MLTDLQTSDGAESVPESPHQAESDVGFGSASVTCEFDGCGEVIRDLTLECITRHLVEDHFHAKVSDWRKSGDDKIHCLWPGCRLRGAIKKRSLAKHVSTSHLKTTETRCNVPGCDAVLSREDARHRHVLTVHRSAAA